MGRRLTVAPLPVETPNVIFDITRLYRNRLSAFGTGIDRIDLAIALDLEERFGARCRFVHVCHGGFAEMRQADARMLLTSLAHRWDTGTGEGGPDLKWPLLAARARRPRWDEGSTYVVASHSGLPQRAGYLKRFDPDGVIERIAYIHDIIPIEYPEYQTERSNRVLTLYLDELTARPCRFVVNSADTGRRLASYLEARGRPIAAPQVNVPKLSAMPEVSGPMPPSLANAIGGAPFFLVLGTIEPRKNHILLFNIWREMAREGTPPKLVVAGKRGWMNDNIVAVLDRNEALRAHILEFSDLSDREIGALMLAARALLFPSFAEGLGIPLLEARAAGLPAVVSNVPALLEIGGEDTVYLDPLDGLGWRREIERLAAKAH